MKAFDPADALGGCPDTVLAVGKDVERVPAVIAHPVQPVEQLQHLHRMDRSDGHVVIPQPPVVVKVHVE